MKHENIILILGNHDLWLASYIDDYLEGKRARGYPYNTFELLKEQLSMEQLHEISDWISDFPCYLTVSVNDKLFMIAHARSFEAPDQVSKQDMIMSDVDYQYLKRGIDGYISIVGHTPTNLIRYWIGEDQVKKNTIWINSRKNVVCIDCGCGFPDAQSQLGCFRLNDFKCFYI